AAALILSAAVKVDAERTTRRQPLDDPDIVDRDQRRIGLAIALREGVAIALEERTRLRARMDRRERLREAFDPGANNFRDRLFQGFPVRIGRRAVAPADDEVHAHQRAFGKERIERADMTL